jgi:antitoxin HicB
MDDTRIMTDEELATAERAIAERRAAARARPRDPEMDRRVKAILERGYPMRVWREPEGYYAAAAVDIDGATGTGPDAAAAVADWRDVAAAWVESALEEGAPIPEPSTPPEHTYSGKFVLRLPRSLHRRLAERADQEGVSLNQLALTLVAEGITARPEPATRSR